VLLFLITCAAFADVSHQGTTIEYGSDKAKGTLASMGWNHKRGNGLPPVWVAVYKV
jgi:hypothetical protein